LDSVEGNVHRDEEEGTLHILHTCLVWLGVEEEKDGEHGRQTSSQEFDIGCLWEAEQIEEVSSAQKTKLVAEASLSFHITVSSSVQF